MPSVKEVVTAAYQEPSTQLDKQNQNSGFVSSWPFQPIGNKEAFQLQRQCTRGRFLEALRGKDTGSVAEAKKKKMLAEMPWTQNSAFQTAVGLVILVNALTLGLEVDYAEEWKDVF